jgi:hypothetical protein
MAPLELVTLECHRQHDVTGLDEPGSLSDPAARGPMHGLRATVR